MVVAARFEPDHRGGQIVSALRPTSKGVMVVAIQKELGIPIKFSGLGEKADDLQPFDPKQFAQ